MTQWSQSQEQVHVETRDLGAALPDETQLGAAPPRMIRHLPKLLLATVDATVLIIAMGLAYEWRVRQGGLDITAATWEHVLVGAVTVPAFIAIVARQKLYTARFVVRRIEEYRRIVRACAGTAAVMAGIGYVFQLPVSRAWLIATVVLAGLLLGVEREIARRVFARLRRKGRMLRPVVIVGSNEEAQELALMLLEDPTLGYRVVGFVADDNVDDEDASRAQLLGTTQETLEVLHRTQAGGVIVATSSTSLGVCNRLVRDLVHAGIHVELSSALRDISAERLTVRPLGRFPVVYLEPRHTRGWRSGAKRAFDLAVASAAVVIAAPAMLLIALAIKLDSRGPVVFRQTRVGREGVNFEVRKFRTMVADAEERLADLLPQNEADGPLFKLKADPRVTRMGRFLRKTSLDELPQLLNVLRGEMSLVGPRPALPAELQAWDRELHARLRVKPGITGMWQVNGRSDASFEQYSRLDLYYVDNWSLLTDLGILAKTLPAVLFGRGSY